MSQDAELLSRYAQTRDAEAFNGLVEEYADMVYATCLRVTGNVEDARDAAQETFLALARQAQTIRTSVASWLHGVAHRRAAGLVRRDARRQARERKAAGAVSTDTSQPEVSWGELAACLDAALSELPEGYRDPLVRHFLQRETQAQIAKTLQLSPSTVSRRIATGVGRLRKRLRKAGVIASAAVLVALLSKHAVHAAPMDVVAGLGKIALAGIQGGTSGAVAPASLKSIAIGGIAAMKAKTVVIVLIIVAAVVVGVIVAARHSIQHADALAPVVEDTPDTSPQAAVQSGNPLPVEAQAPTAPPPERGSIPAAPPVIAAAEDARDEDAGRTTPEEKTVGDGLDLSSPEATVASLTAALARMDVDAVYACGGGLPSASDLNRENLHTLMTAGPDSNPRLYRLRSLFASIDLAIPIKIVSKRETASVTEVVWLVTLKRDFDMGNGKTMAAGATWQFDAALKQQDGQWFVAGF